jgi:hypothetical protein
MEDATTKDAKLYDVARPLHLNQFVTGLRCVTLWPEEDHSATVALE